VLGSRVAAVIAAVIMTGATAGCSGFAPRPAPLPEGCLVIAGETAVVIDPEQSKYASIIAGLSVRRGLPARAASIALTTAYQESDIYNLDYGDRDSLGLFQQRPSQGWGSKKQIMDPYYSTGAFYDALVKIKNWQRRDITEVAQAVQISGYPDAYRDHEADGRALASALTGHSAAAVTCLDRSTGEGDAKGLAKALRKTFGKVSVDRDGSVLRVTAKTERLAWAYGHFAAANLAEFGVTGVTVGDRTWQAVPEDRGEWGAAADPAGDRQVIITVR